MSKEIILIDNVSSDWVHLEFNRSIISNMDEFETVILRSKQYDILSECPKVRPFKLLNLIKKILFFSDFEIIFLTLHKKDIILALLLAVFGRVSFFVHKYNIYSFKNSLRARIAYNIVKIFGIKAIRLDEPPDYFIKTYLYEKNIFRYLNQYEKLPRTRSIHRIILVGAADPEKNIDGMMSYIEKYKLKLLHITDEITSDSSKYAFTTCKYNEYLPKNGDVIWGCYNGEEYKGIKSGLPYTALKFSIPILVNNFTGFMFFSEIFADYLYLKNE